MAKFKTDPEFLALRRIVKLFGDLNPEAQARVLAYLRARFPEKVPPIDLDPAA